MKLNQAIAITNGEKSKAQSVMTTLYHKLQKADLFEGFSKKYKPNDEDSKETLPDEAKNVQLTVADVIAEGRASLERLINTVATIDVGNTTAKAAVVVDGVTILANVPATHLIFLEKQLVDAKTFVEKFPTLDAAEKWTNIDEVTYRTEGSQTNRTAKRPYSFIKAEATDKHPAQAEILTRDETIGQYTTVRFSGACKRTEKNELLERIDKLAKAVKIAREEANAVDVSKQDFGTAISKFIFG